jgi:hypothetical protein
VRAFDADDKEIGTYPTMDEAAAALFALAAGAMLSVGAPPAATRRPA